MDSLVRLNTSLCLVVGLSLNSLLYYFILKHSTADLRVYVRILLQTVVFNALYLCAVYAFGPVYVANSAGTMTYGVGPLVRSALVDGVNDAENRAWNITVYAVWLYTKNAIQFTVGAQFIFRYRALCHGSVMSGRCYSVVLGSTLLVALAVCLPLLLVSNPTTSPPMGIFDSVGMPHNVSIALATLNLPSNGMGTVFFAFTTSLEVGLYATIACCSVRMWLHMRRALAQLPAESLIRTSQINAVFVVQALVPTLFDFAPSMFVRLLGAVLHISAAGPYTTTYVLMLFNWGPIVGALAVFGVVKPYRRVLGKVVRKLCGKANVSKPQKHQASVLYITRTGIQ